MSNINAAIGLAQLTQFDKHAAVRQDIARFYDRELSGLKGVRPLRHNYDDIIPFNYTIYADKRDLLMEYLEKKGIGTVINYIPNHLQPIFRSRKLKLANSEAAYKKILSIPMHAAMCHKDAEAVVGAIKEFYKAR
jgi:dTDP-4-amino-4,6-dideoxygalactose transaminase